MLWMPIVLLVAVCSAVGVHYCQVGVRPTFMTNLAGDLLQII